MNTDWRTFAAQTFKLEKQYLTKLEEAIKHQLTGAATNLKTFGPAYTMQHMDMQAWNHALLPILRQLYSHVALTGAKRSYRELQAQVRTGTKSGSMGHNDDWIKQVQEYLDKYLLDKSVVPVSETTKAYILKVLQEGTANGSSVDAMVKQLEDAGYIRARARLVVRTEVNRASNFGHKIGAASTPYEVDKRWVSAADGRTRNSHMDINNTIVSEDGLFKVEVFKGNALIGYDEMEYPCDPNGSAANVCNCRCRITMRPKRDATGKLVMRQAPETPGATGARPIDLRAIFNQALQTPPKPVFTPAKDIKEAEERILKAGVKEVTLKGLKVPAANAVLKAVEDEASHGNFSLDKLQTFRSSGSYALALYSPSNNTVSLNLSNLGKYEKQQVKSYEEQLVELADMKDELRQYLSDPKYKQSNVLARLNSLSNRTFQVKKKIGDGETARPWTVSSTADNAEDSLYLTITHELGHYRHYRTIGENTYFNFIAKNSVSEYGRTNSHEYLAEWFAYYRKNGSAGVPELLLKLFKQIDDGK